MVVVFADVKKFREVQGNHFIGNMENYSVTGLLRGNRALVQKNMKNMELKSTNQNEEVEDKGW